MARTIIVSNRLPTKVRRTDDGLAFAPSEGGLATGLGSVYQQGDNLWVGWPGTFLDDEAEQAHVTQQLAHDHMYPVFLTEDEIRDFYEGFSNETLWPTFHYFPQYARYEPHLWAAYQAVNRKFCDAVLAVAGPDDTIWVHDYQLLLLPQLLREALPTSTVGFFLHIPFPSYELMRVLPWNRELLKGMLGADLIGFHTYSYMRHFLSAVSRVLGYSNQNGLVEAGQRTVLVDSVPMGIDYDKYASAAASDEARRIEQEYRQAIGEQVQVVLSIDRLDYTKGIAERLRAFELLLQQNPTLHEQVALLMLVVPSRDQVEQYKQLKEEIDELVGRINAAYRTITWTPIQYFYRSFPPEELAALYRLADVALVTPMRDGMNLVAKEFIASKGEGRGVLILSERAGAARELADALIINPTDTAEVAATLHRALAMPPDEQQQYLASMQAIVRRYDVHNWVEVFMNRLAYIKIKQQVLATDTLGPWEVQQLQADYHAAQRRLLLLDYDGTLVGFNPNPQRVQPDAELRQLLTDLTTDARNRVVIISGRDRHTLWQWLGDLPLDFITEHGVWLKRHEEDWNLIQPLRNDWKREIRPILELHVSRTAGSFVEEKEYSLVWHYRKTDDELGEMRARELVTHLSFVASNTGLQVLEGNKVIEIKNAGIDKGLAAARWVQEFDPGFILAFGDDRTDEDTFRVLPKTAYTVKVGHGVRSLARFHIESSSDVRQVLASLAAPGTPHETDGPAPQKQPQAAG
ncbi:bifunctional alpha,alpha-trehalose-phosphate synthase (UDP-forming)/trehalose-phosphatase [Hymenobacter busanensis]|uniref:Bifunctional alpha,alpha-trehalose-phosphate synthase (UDP-forming)/trehalose-phosphatase n=1 Tax=Hymenobacter busanensis TaxID=2607656 RepID=A0A7L4ZXR2_9BACT|nr:bifunctional alpha,alpha-trehalose-phosphate synthase (UDP-forming)/trehalose-phosphatase [Hymenobacter busanensis]KAA9333027.1 bifunctional alpha,alpha-trehalose-phosphate synthase (UDP-forming)/trehalose-phosphatase [Hymenobacter busanensis]QHJ08299.1 bifunctional alpha,alpha-trehalose-phosphate synthase (UDP-forming)/trehalose-phosphatase [Hymenobacter busanensis]